MANKGKPWFAAHAIMYFRTRSTQREFYVWENVYLIKAQSARQAKSAASRFAKAASGADHGDLRIQNKPATLVFGGIRKVVECQGDPTTFKPAVVRVIHDGVEATYSKYTVRGKNSLRALIKGRPVTVVYDE
jgi:hypothetical protein